MAITSHAYRVLAAILVVSGLAIWACTPPAIELLRTSLHGVGVLTAELPATSFSPTLAEPQDSSALRDLGCFDIQTIALSGAEQLGGSIRSGLLAPMVGHCLGPVQLHMLMQRISEHYRVQGYASPQVYMPPQNLLRGRLEITVVEGELDRSM